MADDVAAVICWAIPERAARWRMVCLSASHAPGGAPAASSALNESASPRAAARCEARVPAAVLAPVGGVIKHSTVITA